MKELCVTILTEQGFVPTELALVRDALRIADRLATEVRILCRVCTSGDADLVEGMGDVLVRAAPFQAENGPLPDHLIVLGGSGIRARFAALKSRLRWLGRMGKSVILMSDAAAEWRRLNPERDQMTTHWEQHQADCDAASHAVSTLPLYSRTGSFTTTGGMTAAADVVLATVIAPVSARLAEAVANVMLLERIRDGSVSQPRSANESAVGGQCKMHRAIAAMETHLEDPLAIADLAMLAGLSLRHFERKFKYMLGLTPNAFYRMLRLRRARVLLEQTGISIGEIALCCGFGSASHFSKLYAAEFGVVPSRRRAQLGGRTTPDLSSNKPQGSFHAPVPFSARAARPSAHSS